MVTYPQARQTDDDDDDDDDEEEHTLPPPCLAISDTFKINTFVTLNVYNSDVR